MLVVLAIAGKILVRLRGGIEVTAHNEFEILSDFRWYRQDDEEWAMERLGDSEYARESSGCLVTCIASAMSSYGMELNPGEMSGYFLKIMYMMRQEIIR